MIFCIRSVKKRLMLPQNQHANRGHSEWESLWDGLKGLQPNVLPNQGHSQPQPPEVRNAEGLMTQPKKQPLILTTARFPPMKRMLLWFELETVPFVENPKIRQTCLYAGLLGGAPIHTRFTNSKTKTLFKDIEKFYSTSFTATGISMLQIYSQTAVRLRLARSLRCCCSKP